MTTPGVTTDDIASRTDTPRPTGDATSPTRTDAPATDETSPTTPYPDEATTPAAPGAATQQHSPDDAPLLDDATADPFARRWSEVQARFVDDPRQAVRDADGLVAELMQALAERFAQHKGGLEEQWTRGDEPDTESLRLALQQYRSFFDRLLST